MCRRGGHAEIYQAQHFGEEDPARFRYAGESSGHQSPWPAGLYAASPTVSALPGHSRAHKIYLISSCGKIVYQRPAIWLSWLTIPPECFYQHLVNMRHGGSKCPKASVFAGFFCFNVERVFIFFKVWTQQRVWLQVRLSSMPRWRRLCLDACPYPQETHQKLVEYHLFDGFRIL